MHTLNYFTHTYRHTSFAAHCVKEFEEKKPKHLTAEINIEMIQQEIFRRDRFLEIAVAVIDYSMPPMNGVELSKKLKELGIFTILLTGEAENELAISALNKGEIDYFVKKTGDGLRGLLIGAIQRLEKRFFLNQSASLLSKMSQQVLSCLSDREVADVFDALCQQNEIVEYFLFNEGGSFLMVDKAGQPSYFVLASEKDMETYYNNARIEEAPQIIVEALKNRTMIPFFHTDKDLTDILPTEWENYLHKATRIDGEQPYYYAYIKDPKRYPLKSNKILSYQKYLKSI